MAWLLDNEAGQLKIFEDESGQYSPLQGSNNDDRGFENSFNLKF
jgi:hypothetical protein